MRKQSLVAVAMATMMVVAMATGCSDSKNDETTKANETTTVAETTEAQPDETTVAQGDASSEDDEENYNTGDAALDKVRNEDEIGEKELLVVSFGTSFNDSRRLTIGAIEQKIDDSFGKDFSVRRGFTSQIIIDHVKKRDNISIDNVKEALDRAVNNGVKTLVVQPTHLMNGLEYTDLVNEVGDYADAFEKVVIGEPLLTSDDDFSRVAEAVHKDTEAYNNEETAIVFMGHGTEAESNQIYAKMQTIFEEKGYTNYYVGTVEAEPSLEDVVKKVKEGNYKKVVLQPLMIVAGDHANNDMAGDEEGSWKTTFEAEGFEVTCVVKGLGELEEVQTILAEHAKKAIDSLSE